MNEIVTFYEFCQSQDLAEEGIRKFQAYLAFRLGSMETDREESTETWGVYYQEYLIEAGFHVN